MSIHMVNLPKEPADFHLAHYPTECSTYPDIARVTIEMGAIVQNKNTNKPSAYAKKPEKSR